jgi:uncharacterized membrane protein
METIEKSIEVNAPVSAVYNQWTQFEDFPKFMEGIKEVRQLDNKRLHWKAEIAGRIKEWDAEIYEQVPDEKIAWRSISGPQNAGLVRFDKTGENTTRVALLLSYQPETTTEKIGDAIGLVAARVTGDLKRFQEFIEARGMETGGWRGEIHGGREGEPGGGTLRSAADLANEPRSKRIRGTK